VICRLHAQNRLTRGSIAARIEEDSDVHLVKGQSGTAYTVLGVNGASCATGLKSMPKWTRERATFDLKPIPRGWHCSAIGDYSALAKLEQCTTTKGGIFEWLPQRKK
jgi:hypothetical protein